MNKTVNFIAESDIAHVGRVMRAFLLFQAPQQALVDYWRRRVAGLLASKGLVELEIHALRGLLRELDELDAATKNTHNECRRGAQSTTEAKYGALV
jgi:hypothetical protein